MEPLLLTVGQYLAKTGGPPVARAIGSKLRNRSWARKVAKKSLKSVPKPRPKRALVRWLRQPATWEFLASPNGPDERVILDLDSALSRGDMAYLRSVKRTWWWVPKDVRHQRCESLLASIYQLVLTEHDANWAIRIASERGLSATRAVRAEVGEIGARIESYRADADRSTAEAQEAYIDALLEKVPLVVHRRFKNFWWRDKSTITKVLQLVCDPESDPLTTLASWASINPPWIDSTPDSQLAVGELAYAYGAKETAMHYFCQAIKNGSSRAAYYEARIASMALEEDQCIEPSGPRITTLGTSQEPLARAVHLCMSDPVAAREYLESWDPTDTIDQILRTTLLYRLAINECGERLTVSCLNRCLAVLQDGISRTNASGLAMQRAMLLLVRIAHGGSRSADEDLVEARDLSLTARDSRRKCRIRSVDSVAFACRASRSMEDFEGAIRIGSHGTGEATLVESNDAKVRSEVAISALALGDIELASDCLEYLEDGYDKWHVEALMAEQRGDDSRSKWVRALDAAEGDEQRAQALAGMARLGALTATDLSQLAVSNPEAADELAAVAEAASGNFEGAISTLRPKQQTSLSAALMLADVYQKANRPFDSAQVLQDASIAFGEPSLALRSATELAHSGHRQEARQVVEQLLVSASPNWTGRANALGLAAQLAIDSDDVETAIPLMQARLDLRPNDEVIRWAIVGCHLRVRNPEAAQSVFDESPTRMRPRDEAEAHIWLELSKSRLSIDELCINGLLFLDEFGRTETLAAHVLSLGFTVVGDQRISTEVLRQMQAELELYRETYPLSQQIQQIGSETPEEAIRNVTNHLRRSRDEIAVYRELNRRVAISEVPIGFLAAHAGRSYAEILVRRATGVIPARHVATLEQRLCDDSITQFHNMDVVIEASASFTLSMLPVRIQNQLLAVFRRPLTTHNAVFDARQARDSLGLRSTASFYYDPQGDTARVAEISAEEADRLATEAVLLHDALASYKVIARPSTPVLGEVDAQQFEGWSSCLDLAATLEVVFWSDDPALRKIARALSVPCFSTPALLVWLLRRDEIDDDAYRASIDTLFDERIGDFPLQISRVLESLERNQWRTGHVRAALARPAAWVNRASALTLYSTIVDEIAVRHRDEMPAFLYAAVSGLALSQHGVEGLSEVTASVLGLTLLRSRSPEMVRFLVAATRVALEEHADGIVSDPLAQVARSLRDAVASEVSFDIATQYVIGLFKDLSDADRQLVLATILER